MQVVDGAHLVCSFGTTPSSLVVMPTNQTQIENQFAANIMDHIPMVNIMPFGMCMSIANPQVAATHTLGWRLTPANRSSFATAGATAKLVIRPPPSRHRGYNSTVDVRSDPHACRRFITAPRRSLSRLRRVDRFHGCASAASAGAHSGASCRAPLALPLLNNRRWRTGSSAACRAGSPGSKQQNVTE